MKKLLLIIVAILSTGCMTFSGANKFQSIEINNSESIVYVYRKKQFVGSAGGSSMLNINGNRITKLKMGGYVPVKVSPGKVELSLQTTLFGKNVSKPFSVLSIEASGGKAYYFRYSQTLESLNNINGSIISKGSNHFIPIPAEIAQEEIKNYKLLSKVENP